MKIRTCLALLVLAAFAAAEPQTLRFVRNYAVGDIDVYGMVMKMDGDMAMELSMDTSQKVVKVYENGDADVETTLSGGKVHMMGRDQPIPTGKPAIMRLSKYGSAVGAGGGGPMGMDFAKYASQLPKEGLTVGQTLTFDDVDATNPKSHVKGTTKLESVEGGVAKVVSVLDVTTSASPTPMHLEFTSLIDASNSKLRRVDGKITNLAGGPAGMKFNSITMVMERKG